MNKKMIVMRIVAIIMAFAFSVQCFAAVVSDNDGSAFITKAEFDSLKNTFQAQIDQFNTSIDSKIDAAIAAYLSGIVITKEVEQESYVNKIYESYFNGKNVGTMFGVRNDSTYSTNDVNKTMSIATWYDPDATGQTFLSSNGGNAKTKVSYVNLVTKKKINNVWHYFDMGYLHDFLAGTQVCGTTYYTYAAAKGRNNSNTILEPTSTNEDGYYDCGNYNLYSEIQILLIV